MVLVRVVTDIELLFSTDAKSNKGNVGIVVKKIGNSSIRYEVGVFKEKEYEPCAVGYFVHVYVNRAQQEKVIPIPSNIYIACKTLLKNT